MIKYYLEFDWVFLITGDGHYEMNLMKSFMELNWHVFMTSFVDEMGWKSEKAQRCALICSDNHKAWQMLLIFHLSTLLELVRPYVQKCVVETKQASAEGFISFVKTQENNANFMYLFEMACMYSQGLINIRMGVCRNNSKLLQAGKWMSKELFHGRNHPKYQEIEIYETFVFHLLPLELENFLNSNCSVSKSGHESKGQGYDFLLEEENKTVKSWLKRGVPTEKLWLTVCRNHQVLKKIRKKVLDLTGCATSEVYDRGLKLDKAIDEWRLQLRQTKYMDGEKHGQVLTAITTDVLDQGLLHFSMESNRKRAYRILDMLLHQAPPTDPTLHHPVYILPSERDRYFSVENMSIPDIDNMIIDIIETMDKTNQHTFMDMFVKMTRNKSTRKQGHIQFLEEVTTIQTQMQSIIDGPGLLDDVESED